MYDERKNKMVSYCSSGFDHNMARNLYKDHTEMRNKKLESYSEQNYKYFVVNSSIEDHANPYLIFNIEKESDKPIETNTENLDKKITAPLEQKNLMPLKLPEVKEYHSIDGKLC